jgi:hypothetical protein
MARIALLWHRQRLIGKLLRVFEVVKGFWMALKLALRQLPLREIASEAKVPLSSLLFD